jgi:DNA polymerase
VSGGRLLQSENPVDDVIALLQFYQALGIERLPLDISLKRRQRGVSAVPSAVRVSGPETMTVSERATAYTFGLPSADEKAGLLASLRAEIGDCTRCALSASRKNIVFGEGTPNAGLMFIGEGPGEEEDISSRPFVGKAGVLLTRLIEKMELQRSNVYIANVVKCRPPENREPEADEVATCKPFLEGQIDIIRPKVIVTLGRVALQSLMDNTSLKISGVRGRFLEYRGIPVMPTFHPAYLLRNPAEKWKTWADAQKALERLSADRA